jgi:hypothetical protein
LKPRTVDAASTAAPVKSSGSKPDPFGGAKPVDTKTTQELEKKSDDKEQ